MWVGVILAPVMGDAAEGVPRLAQMAGGREGAREKHAQCREQCREQCRAWAHALSEMRKRMSSARHEVCMQLAIEKPTYLPSL